MEAKYKKESKITPLYRLNLEVVFHYITLTCYNIIKDTLAQHVIASP